MPCTYCTTARAVGDGANLCARYPNCTVKLPPKLCDVCQEPVRGQAETWRHPETRAVHEVFVDGKTRFGPWGDMCLTCHYEHGVGLGTGKGKLYDTTTGEKLDG
jgi:hypothetical protein